VPAAPKLAPAKAGSVLAISMRVMRASAVAVASAAVPAATAASLSRLRMVPLFAFQDPRRGLTAYLQTASNSAGFAFFPPARPLPPEAAGI
jgi:hypothetical protein